MAETLTESFCERCGTRYEFQAPTRLNSLRKTRGFIGGLRNYLTSQDDLSDAMGDSMRSEEGNLASAQLEAFHETFNFCIDCRQYTCLNCWNDDAGRCRSCAPIPGTDDLAERLAASAVAAAPVAEMQTALADDALVGPLALEAWPSSDLATDPAATNADPTEPWPTAEAFPVEPEPVVAQFELDAETGPLVAEIEFDPEPEPVAAAIEPEPEPEPGAAEIELEPEPVVTESEIESIQPALRVVAWDEDVAYEFLTPEPVAAEVEVEPVAAEVEVEPVAARITPMSDSLVRFPTRPTQATPRHDERAAAIADSPELAARRAQLELLGLGDPGQESIGQDRSPALPYRSRGAAITQSELARQAATRGSFWEASAREVAGAAAQVGVGNCGQCGLSLSANARFCRRCGIRQAQSA